MSTSPPDSLWSRSSSPAVVENISSSSFTTPFESSIPSSSALFPNFTVCKKGCTTPYTTSDNYYNRIFHQELVTVKTETSDVKFYRDPQARTFSCSNCTNFQTNDPDGLRKHYLSCITSPPRREYHYSDTRLSSAHLHRYSYAFEVPHLCLLSPACPSTITFTGSCSWSYSLYCSSYWSCRNSYSEIPTP